MPAGLMCVTCDGFAKRSTKVCPRCGGVAFIGRNHRIPRTLEALAETGRRKRAEEQDRLWLAAQIRSRL